MINCGKTIAGGEWGKLRAKNKIKSQIIVVKTKDMGILMVLRRVNFAVETISTSTVTG
jgi:hypothetical protein